MKIEKCRKESFVVIGKEGATTDGAGFIQKLWEDANSHFGEVVHLGSSLWEYRSTKIIMRRRRQSISSSPWISCREKMYGSPTRKGLVPLATVCV